MFPYFTHLLQKLRAGFNNNNSPGFMKPADDGQIDSIQYRRSHHYAA